MKPVHIEVIHEGEHCIPCVYMALVVAEVAPDYGDAVTWEKVIITKKKGAFRFDELAQNAWWTASCALHIYRWRTGL